MYQQKVSSQSKFLKIKYKIGIEFVMMLFDLFLTITEILYIELLSNGVTICIFSNYNGFSSK